MTRDGEPLITQWTQQTYAELLERLRVGVGDNCTVVVGIDGRSGSGKSTLAAHLAEQDTDVTVIHTDDIAWHHSYFDWDHLLVVGILDPVRRLGPPIAFRPPAWAVRRRPGAITVPGGTRVLLVEGVGACRRQLHPWYDHTVWVQTDADLAYQRVLARGTDPLQLIDEWTAHENPFLATDRPWERANTIISGETGPPNENTILTADINR